MGQGAPGGGIGRRGEGDGIASGGMAAVILADAPETRATVWQYLLYGTGPEAQSYIVENTGYMPVNEGAPAPGYLGAFHDAHPAWESSAEQLHRADPWFAWPGRNGVRISQLVADAIGRLPPPS